jgi:hypothetical protein
MLLTMQHKVLVRSLVFAENPVITLLVSNPPLNIDRGRHLGIPILLVYSQGSPRLYFRSCMAT